MDLNMIVKHLESSLGCPRNDNQEGHESGDANLPMPSQPGILP